MNGVDLKVSENIVQYVAAACNGDTDAMAKLYSKTLKASYFLASVLSAEDANAVDITKKAYAKAFSSIDKLKRPEAFEIWMKQNVAAAYKEGKKFVFADADAGATENSSEFLSEDVFEDEEKSASVLKAVAELRPELRAALILHYNNGMPVSILAKFFGVSESTANALLGKARATVLASAGLEADSSSSGSLPVLTRIFQRAAVATSIDNTVVRDVFIYAIDAYEASKPAAPVEEEQPAPAIEEAPAVEEKAEPEEEPVQEAEEAPAEPEAEPVAEAPQSNIISFKQKISEILEKESVPAAAEEEAAPVEAQEAEEGLDIPDITSPSEEAERAVEHFSSYEKPEAPAAPEKKKLDIKLNKKVIGIACACLAVLVVICVAISKIGSSSDAPAGNDGSTNAVDAVAAGYQWVAGGFAECTEIEYLDENCAYFKSASTGKYGLLDYQGNVILQPNYDGFKRCATGRDYEGTGLYHSLVIINGEEHEISVDNGGVTISETLHIDHSVSSVALDNTAYDERDRYFEGYAAARKDGKWGYVSQDKDKRVIKYEYDAVNEFTSALDSAGSDYCRPVTGGLIAVKKDSSMGIIDLENETVVPFEYSNIMPGSDGVFIACKGGTWGVILVGDAVTSFGGVNISVDPVSPIEDEDTTGSSSASTLDSYTVISEDGANVRDGAGSDYDLLGELNYGDTVVGYETQRADNGNKWVKIKYNGEYGWVALSMLEEEGV